MGSKNPIISVILPVYNVEPYLERCMESLVNQTFRDMEIIAVNDGSPDHCLEILRRFERDYDFVTVIDQKNCGMSQARNNGLAIARGEYVSFVDSDDFVAPTFLEKLYRACVDNDAEISYCSYYYRFVESEFLFEHPFRYRGVLSGEQAMHKLLHDTQIQSMAWNKLYKKCLFTDHDITYPSMTFEDMATACRLFCHVNRVAMLDEPLYYYNQRSGSTLATMSAPKINDLIRALAMVRISLEKNGVYEKYKKSYLALTRKTFGTCCMYVLKLHNKQKCMRGCLTNMKRAMRAIRHYNADTFSPLFSNLPDVVYAPEKLEKDYSTR